MPTLPDRHHHGEVTPQPAPVCDFHVHLGWSSSQAASSPEETVAVLRTAGFSSAVIFPFERSAGIDYRRANDVILRSAARWPELCPFARVDTRDLEASLDELRRARAAGAVGLKLHPLNDHVDPADPATERIFEEARDLGIPIILHTNRGDRSEPKSWEPLAAAMPELTVVLGHAGFFLWRDAMEVAWRNENVYLETSLAEAISLAQIAEFSDLGRVLFGSDHPYGDPRGSAVRLQTALSRVGASEAQVRATLSDNAARVLGRALPSEPLAATAPPSRRTAPAVLRCRDREVPATAYDLFDLDCAVLLEEPSVDPADADEIRIRLDGAWYRTDARVVFGWQGRYGVEFADPPSDLQAAIARWRAVAP